MQVGSVEQYLAHGPGFMFLAHPALGPLWQVVGQKLRGGCLAPHSEVQLEVAEACWRDVNVQGSLLVKAEAPLGHIEQRPAPSSSVDSSSGGSGGRAAILESLFTSTSGGGGGSLGLGSFKRQVAAPAPGSSSASSASGGYSQPCDITAQPCEAGPTESRLVYSSRCGRLRLHNVTVSNAGADWEHPSNVWWRHSLQRHESCRILLRGMSGETRCGGGRAQCFGVVVGAAMRALQAACRTRLLACLTESLKHPPTHPTAALLPSSVLLPPPHLPPCRVRGAGCDAVWRPVFRGPRRPPPAGHRRPRGQPQHAAAAAGGSLLGVAVQHGCRR